MAKLTEITGCTKCCEGLTKGPNASLELSMAQLGAKDTFYKQIATSGVNFKPRTNGGPENSIG